MALNGDELVDEMMKRIREQTIMRGPREAEHLRDSLRSLISSNTPQKGETADSALLEVALDALAGCDSMLSLYYYRGGDALFRQMGLPDKEQVGGAISKARRILDACQYHEKKMRAHEAKGATGNEG